MEEKGLSHRASTCRAGSCSRVRDAGEARRRGGAQTTRQACCGAIEQYCTKLNTHRVQSAPIRRASSLLPVSRNTVDFLLDFLQNKRRSQKISRFPTSSHRKNGVASGPLRTLNGWPLLLRAGAGGNVRTITITISDYRRDDKGAAGDGSVGGVGI